MSTLLYGVGALDPLTYAAVALGLGLTAALACTPRRPRRARRSGGRAAAGGVG